MADAQHRQEPTEAQKEKKALEILQRAVGPLVLVVALVQLWSIYDGAKDDRKASARYKVVADQAKAIAKQAQETADCQSEYNKTFIENLQLRSEATARITDATQKLILTFADLQAKQPNPSVTDKAFKVFKKEITSAERARERHPLKPFPNC